MGRTVVHGAFEWDEDKARANLKKHGISFEEATRVFRDPYFYEVPDEVHSSLDEQRMIGIGVLCGMRDMIIAWQLCLLSEAGCALFHPDGQQNKRRHAIMSGVLGTEAKRLEDMSDEDIDFSDIPEITQELLSHPSGRFPNVSQEKLDGIRALLDRTGLEKITPDNLELAKQRWKEAEDKYDELVKVRQTAVLAEA